jgi:hypothetical protein
MNSENGKVKGFIKKHSGKIKGGLILIGALVICEVVRRDAYVEGAKAGMMIGFGRTVKWCDREFDDLQLTDRVNTWAVENPEKWSGGLLEKEKA